MSALDRQVALLTAHAQADVLALETALGASRLLKACVGCEPHWTPELHPRGPGGKFARTSGKGDEKRGKAATNERRRRRQRRAAVGAGVVAGAALAAMMSDRGGPPRGGGREHGGSGGPPHGPLAIEPGRPPQGGRPSDGRNRSGDRFAQTMFGAPRLGEPGRDPAGGDRPWPEPGRNERAGPRPSGWTPPVYTVDERDIPDEPTMRMRRNPFGDTPAQRIPRGQMQATRPSRPVGQARPAVENTVHLSARDVTQAIVGATAQQVSRRSPRERAPRTLTQTEQAKARQILAWAVAAGAPRQITSREIRAHYDEWLAAFERDQNPRR